MALMKIQNLYGKLQSFNNHEKVNYTEKCVANSVHSNSTKTDLIPGETYMHQWIIYN